MAQHIVIGQDEPIILRMARPGAREKAALRDTYAHLQCLLPMLRFLADVSAHRPEMTCFELSQTGISVPMADIVKLLVVLERVEQELLPKE